MQERALNIQLHLLCDIGHAYETSLSALSPTLPPPPPKKRAQPILKLVSIDRLLFFQIKLGPFTFVMITQRNVKKIEVVFDTVEEIAATRKILTRKLYCVEENSNKNVSLKIILLERPKKLICLILCFDYLRQIIAFLQENTPFEIDEKIWKCKHLFCFLAFFWYSAGK